MVRFGLRRGGTKVAIVVDGKISYRHAVSGYKEKVQDKKEWRR